MSGDNDKDNRFEQKFDYIINEISKQKSVQLTSMDKLSKILEEKYNLFIKQIDTKANLICKDNIEKLIPYSHYDKESNTSVPVSGYEEQFNSAQQELSNCKSNFDLLAQNVNEDNVALNNLVNFSFANCIDECKTETKTNKLNENQAKKCVEACFRYQNINFQSYYKLMSDSLNEKEKALDKLEINI